MKLSDNFSLSEFTKSQVALRNGIDNTPNEEVIENLKPLCQNVLQPIREYYLMPVFISSGYRSAALNHKLGSSISSQHIQGQAADIEIFGVSNKELSDWINDNCDFDQLILEFHKEDDANSGWVHVSYKKDNNRKQYKRADRNEEGKVEYTFV